MYARKVIASLLVSLLCVGRLTSLPKHKITLTFDYDFGTAPPCSAEAKQRCVQQFNFYDISLGIQKRIKLGSFPVPADAKGLVKGISVTTKPLALSPGRHMIAVAAQMADGPESDLNKCTVIVMIP